jgi:hypothetical protein
VDYVGVRGELDILFQSEWFPRSNLIAGLGTRYWHKRVHSVTAHHRMGSTRLPAYNEDWWTIYPYLGIETKKTEHGDWRPYGSARLGLTAFTMVNNSIHPTPGIMAQFEAGFSNQESSVGLYYDLATWGSDGSGRDYQPAAGMGFFGIKFGLLY